VSGLNTAKYTFDALGRQFRDEMEREMLKLREELMEMIVWVVASYGLEK
jgi:hypothetical protein